MSMSLLAAVVSLQAQIGPTTPAPPTAADALPIIIVALVVMAIMIAVNVVICYLLYSAQQAIPPEHRKIEPGMVWLLLIPFFNIVWNFFVFLRIPESYQSYFWSVGRNDVGDAGKALGLWFSICVILAAIPCVGALAGIAALVLLIMFLVKINGLKNQIQSPGGRAFPV